VAGKADGLRHLARLAGVEREDTVFVGDSYNDRDAALAAGTSIAFNCRDPRLSSVATHTIPWPARDLRAILPFLGFS
jgi:phosphoserine phosphatase